MAEKKTATKKTEKVSKSPQPSVKVEDGVTRPINKKPVRKIRVGDDRLPVVEVVHKQDGAEVTYKAKNNRKKTELVGVGDFGRLIHY
jgi:hypothetical protein